MIKKDPYICTPLVEILLTPIYSARGIKGTMSAMLKPIVQNNL